MLVGFAFGFGLAAALGALAWWWLATRLKSSRASVQDALARAQLAERLAAAGDPVFVLAVDGAIRDLNAPAARVLDEGAGAIGAPLTALVHPDDRKRVVALTDPASAGAANGWAELVRLRGAAGAWRTWEATLVAPPAGGAGASAAEETLLRLRDVGEREALRAELAGQRLYDPATGLPARSLFLDRLAHALALAARRAEVLGVFLLDPGVPAVVPPDAQTRDRLAAAIAQRVQLALRDGDSVARLDAGRFGLLLESLHDVLDAAAVAERVLNRFLAPLPVGGVQVLLTPQVGIALSGGHEQPEDLLHQAAAALVAVRRGNLAPYAIFDPSMTVSALDQAGLETDLRRALTNGEVRLLYHPVVRLDDGRVTAYEARPVWQHPNRGPIPTAEVMALAEATAMTLPLQRWILASACRQIRDWLETNPHEPPLVCLDVAPQAFRHPGLAGDVARVLHEAGLSPQHLRLEIDQDLVLEDVGSTVTRLQALKGIGVRIAIDGFGTGYAALGFLQRSPVDCLKIGASYVAGLGVNPDDSAIVQAALAFAHGLEIPVVAVGVETATQRDELRRLGCAFGQGGFFGPPLTADQVRDAGREAVEARLTPTAEPDHPADPQMGETAGGDG